MRYVLNSSVGFKWLIVEQHSDKANKLRELRNAVHELLAPKSGNRTWCEQIMKPWRRTRHVVGLGIEVNWIR